MESLNKQYPNFPAKEPLSNLILMLHGKITLRSWKHPGDELLCFCCCCSKAFPNQHNQHNQCLVYSTKNLGVKPNRPTNLHPTFYIVYLSIVKVGYTGCVIGIPHPTSDTNLTFTHPTIPPSAHPHAIRRVRYNEVLHNGRDGG